MPLDPYQREPKNCSCCFGARKSFWPYRSPFFHTCKVDSSGAFYVKTWARLNYWFDMPMKKCLMAVGAYLSHLVPFPQKCVLSARRSKILVSRVVQIKFRVACNLGQQLQAYNVTLKLDYVGKCICHMKNWKTVLYKLTAIPTLEWIYNYFHCNA